MKKLTITVVLAMLLFPIFAQKYIAPNKYLIEFTDKNGTPYSIAQPEQFLSQRALERREHQKIAITENDLPINPLYIDSLKHIGFTILNRSRWFNSITVQANDVALLAQLQKISFVVKNTTTNISTVNRTANATNSVDNEIIINLTASKTTENVFNYGSATNQIEMLNGQVLHNLGFQGQGIVIAVLDAGFTGVNLAANFQSLFANNQILGGWDFVDGDSSVYHGNTHGTQVLSTMAGNVPNVLVGTAPKANFWLFRSEDGASEYPVEEENWISAAEYADSVGADIITSSLGYSEFDDGSLNHNYSDMDGKTTRISRGANMAASKGIFVVSSAGNEGNKKWHYITAPADAANVLTVGAVYANGNYAEFSSTGPTFDRQIKPNVVAQGVKSTVFTSSGTVATNNGTSFSCPIIAGMVACLWQAHPELTNLQLKAAIEHSANRFTQADSLCGYGIPDFAFANLYPDANSKNQLYKDHFVNVYPNPFSDKLNIQVYFSELKNTKVELFDIMGRAIYTGNYIFDLSAKKFTISGLNHLQQGIYILKFSSEKTSAKYKLIKQ